MAVERLCQLLVDSELGEAGQARLLLLQFLLSQIILRLFVIGPSHILKLLLLRDRGSIRARELRVCPIRLESSTLKWLVRVR